MDYDADLQLLLKTSSYSATTINNGTILRENIIESLTNASVTVRYDLDNYNDIECTIDNINPSTNNATHVMIDFFISVETKEKLLGWETDIDSIINVFESNLKDLWNISSSDKTDVDLIDLITSFSTTTTRIATTNSGNGNKTQNINNDSNSNIVGELSETSFLTLICLCCVSFIITLAAYIDAIFIKHNELFKPSTMVIVTMYLMDVVSGIE